jgi:hypothetical protein
LQNTGIKAKLLGYNTGSPSAGDFKIADSKVSRSSNPISMRTAFGLPPRRLSEPTGPITIHPQQGYWQIMSIKVRPKPVLEEALQPGFDQGGG